MKNYYGYRVMMNARRGESTLSRYFVRIDVPVVTGTKRNALTFETNDEAQAIVDYLLLAGYRATVEASAEQYNRDNETGATS